MGDKTQMKPTKETKEPVKKGLTGSDYTMGLTGSAYTMRYEHPNLTQLVHLRIENGVVVEESVLTDPDSPMITIAKGEAALWHLYQELRNGY